MKRGTNASHRFREVLAGHLATEEPVLMELFPQVPDAHVVRLRKAVTDGASRGDAPRLPACSRPLLK